MKVVIIGGSAAGTITAVELRKHDKEAGITVLEASNHLMYSHCALPYVISKEIANFKDIFIFNSDYLKNNNLPVVLNAEVKKIVRKTKEVVYIQNKQEKTIAYDKLVIATGSSAFIPPIPNIDKIPYLTFSGMDDAKKIDEMISQKKRAVIVGAGFIGVELAYSLKARGLDVSLVEVLDRILATLFDPDMSQIVQDYLVKQGVNVFVNAKVKDLAASKIVLEDNSLDYDLLILSCGVRANTDLAKEAGLVVDKSIVVDEFMKTSDENIYACGDCVGCHDLIAGKPTMSQLGTTAVRQARVVARNILGQSEKFNPVLNTSVSKIGKLVVGATGFNQQLAKRHGIKTISAKYTGWSREEFHPDAKEITVKLVCDSKGMLVGAQLAGQEGVDGRINLLSLAIQKGMSVQDLATIEMGFNPAVTPITDPIVVAAEICLRKLELKNADS